MSSSQLKDPLSSTTSSNYAESIEQKDSFSIPKTVDMFQALLSPSRWGAVELLTLFLIIIQLFTIFLRNYLPLSYYICVFAFWRLSYNIGIGFLLHYQSHYQAITNWLSQQDSAAVTLLNWATTKSLDNTYRWRKVPPSFNAWIVFRALSTIILANDGLSYFVLFTACMTPFSESSFFTLSICIPLSAALVVLGTWSKADAHHVLGDFGWFWGDFFFLNDQHLVFAGVFKLFPHPMYTVGYAPYYGASLYTRSHALFATSLIAHVLQLLFLVFVEEPHIQRIYGNKDSEVSKEESKGLDLTPSETVDQVEDVKLAQPSIDAKVPTTNKDLNTGSIHTSQPFTSHIPYPVIVELASSLVIFGTVMKIVQTSVYLALSILLICRCAHWYVCAKALQKSPQSSDNGWMSYFLARGYSRETAYNYWQYFYLISYITNHMLFFFVAIAYPAGGTGISRSFSKMLSALLGGGSLIAISMISLTSGWEKLGGYGFFYGDCFTTPPELLLTNEGPFRYFTHPEAVLGYLSYYGLAIIKNSQLLLVAAAFCQCLHIAFIESVEKENIKACRKQAWDMTPLEREIKRLLQILHVDGILRCAKQEFVSLLNKMRDSHGDHIQRRILEQRDCIRTDIQRRVSTVREQYNSKTLELKKGAENVTGQVTSDRVLTTLRRRGIQVQDLS